MPTTKTTASGLFKRHLIVPKYFDFHWIILKENDFTDGFDIPE
jgi:hypothetical protein